MAAFQDIREFVELLDDKGQLRRITAPVSCELEITELADRMVKSGGPALLFENVVDHDMNIAQAIASPRIHHQWMPDRLYHESFGLNPDVARALRARGHRLARRGSIGDAHGIFWDRPKKMFLGAADPRYGGLALGY